MIFGSKRPKCNGCGKRIGKAEHGSEIQLKTADGVHVMKFCDRCSEIIEQMRSVAMRGKTEEDSDEQPI